jgi:hypothetical protein
MSAVYVDSPSRGAALIDVKVPFVNEADQKAELLRISLSICDGIAVEPLREDSQ